MLTARSLAALAAVLLLAACNGAAPSLEATPASTPTAVPGIGGNIGNPGGAPPPGGIVDPGGGLDPILGQAQLVAATAGLVNQHPVNVQLVRASANASGVTAELRWWSGVAPCSALDSVQVAKDDGAKSIKLTVIEGSGRGDVACIDIAQLKATTVDLGELPAGTWSISAEGDAPAITLELG